MTRLFPFFTVKFSEIDRTQTFYSLRPNSAVPSLVSHETFLKALRSALHRGANVQLRFTYDKFTTYVTFLW